LNVFVQLLISEANDVEAARGKPGGAAIVVPGGFRIQMLRTIELDDEFVREANKVNDVRTDCRLTTKLSATQLLRAEEVP
jgi:hypothetical protein